MSKSDKKENIFKRIAKYLIPWKGDKKSEIIRKICFLTAACVLIVAVSLMVNDAVQRAKTKKLDDDRASEFHAGADVSSTVSSQTSSQPESSAPEEPKGFGPISYPQRTVQSRFEPLLEQNPETIGWLTIKGTNESYNWIDYVVMQTIDNDKYLDTDFDGNKVKSGALFADYRGLITPTSEPANIVIYGHNMQSGEYFGRLPYYFNWGVSNPDHNDISFYKEHPTVEFSTLYKTSTYKIFAAIMLNTESDAGEVFYYHNKQNFKSEKDFNNYVAEILDRSTFYNPDVNVQYGDQLLTLSTCMFGYGNTDLRFVVFARETRPGESPTVDVEKAYANPNPKFYDLYYKQYDYVWEGRKWDKKLLVGYEDDE